MSGGATLDGEGLYGHVHGNLGVWGHGSHLQENF